ncbi:MAG TPA: hypothetical protein VIB48_03530 [Acidimicrobiia bacterium]|jgi:hypothetical protein
MDIEEFYDQDPRRRASEEFDFGHDWNDAAGNRFGLSWVQDTGELYLLAEAEESIIVDPAGDQFLPDLPEERLKVEVLGVFADVAAVEGQIAGWAKAMPERDSVTWLRTRLAGKPASAAPDASDAPEELPGASG